MRVRRKHGKIILSQKTRLWFRAATCFWGLVVAMTPIMIYSALFSSVTTRFTCDRDAGSCAVNGRTRDVPPLAGIVRAEMDHDSNRRDGPNWGINLVTRDGRKVAIEDQRAIADSAVADYRRATAAIDAYLGNPGQKLLDVSFTYRASLGEKLQSFFYLGFGIATLLMACAFWTTTAYVFEPGKVTLVTQRLFARTDEEMAAAEISGIDDSPGPDGRKLQLNLDGGDRITIVAAREERAASALDALARELADFLGKPLESPSP